MKINKTLALALLAALQIAVLVGMVVKAALPLWTGREIRVETIPVDPRSLFRGNYAELRYAFSNVQLSRIHDGETLRKGEIIYVTLAPNDRGLYEFAGASLEKPDSGVYLRGRAGRRFFGATAGPVAVDYGIEAFFAPKEEALALERELRTRGVAVLMVSDSGRARLKDVVPAPGS